MILRGSHLIDPAQEINGTADVALGDRVSAELGENLPAISATELIDASGMIVCVGLIVLHEHCYSSRDLFSVDPLDIGRKIGVTTLLDTSSASCYIPISLDFRYGSFNARSEHCMEKFT